jgi:hypothetical protein
MDIFIQASFLKVPFPPKMKEPSSQNPVKEAVFHWIWLNSCFSFLGIPYEFFSTQFFAFTKASIQGVKSSCLSAG